MTKSVPSMLSMLGYTEEWLSLGIVTEESLRSQCAAVERGPDRSTEHFRHGAYLAFLRHTTTLSNDQVTALLALRDAAPDGFDLSHNRAIELIASGILSEAQFDALADHPAMAPPVVARRYRRESLLRKLQRDGLTEELFAAISRVADTHVHAAVLPLASLSQLEWLSSNGANRSIRNRAAQRLDGMKRRARSRHDK